MKVELFERWGDVSIICYVGADEIRVAHMESKLDAEGKARPESEVLTELLNAASAAVGTIPQAEEAPEGETKAQRLEREERNRKALEDWQLKRDEEEEAAELKAAEAASNYPAATETVPPSDPAPWPQPE